MEPVPELTVNLADSADVQAKLPEARKIADDLRARAKELQEQADGWDRLVHVLEGMPVAVNGDKKKVTKPITGTVTGPPVERPERPARGGPTSTDVVVTILDQTGGPMTVAEVHKLAPQYERKTVGWALWKADQLGRAQALPGKGVYAPMSYQPEQIFPSSDQDGAA